MNVLVGCERSQEVTKAFRAKGHSAYSLDIEQCYGGKPQWHQIGDIIEYIQCSPKGKWDLIILHPPCTCIAVSGNGTYAKGKERYQERIDAVKWTESLWNVAIKHCDAVCMENPIGVLNTLGKFPKPQYIQPWQFGHGETKKTGLWLYGLPKLKPTNIVDGREQRIWKMGPSKERSTLRAKTYPGIAQAMAEQWG